MTFPLPPVYIVRWETSPGQWIFGTARLQIPGANVGVLARQSFHTVPREKLIVVANPEAREALRP